jgi:hypothetical protein
LILIQLFYARSIDEGIKFANTRRVLEDIGIHNPTYDDCAIVQHICRQVSKRAARLAGAGMLTIDGLLSHSFVRCHTSMI